MKKLLLFFGILLFSFFPFESFGQTSVSFGPSISISNMGVGAAGFQTLVISNQKELGIGFRTSWSRSSNEAQSIKARVTILQANFAYLLNDSEFVTLNIGGSNVNFQGSEESESQPNMGLSFGTIRGGFFLNLGMNYHFDGVFVESGWETKLTLGTSF